MVLRVIWQFMDRDVAHKILYGPKCLNLNSQLIFVLRYQKFTYYAKHTYKSFTCSRLFNTKHGQTCIKRSSLGHRKSDLLKEVQFIWNFLWQDKKRVTLKYRWLLNRSDCMSRFDYSHIKTIAQNDHLISPNYFLIATYKLKNIWWVLQSSAVKKRHNISVVSYNHQVY